MKVRIVYPEDVEELPIWILGKFALKLNKELNKLHIETEISDKIDFDADINHHIYPELYDGNQSTINTLMITHVDSINYKRILRRKLETAKMGICMSRETMGDLANLGFSRDRLCYVNPAHDGMIKPRQLSIGITCRVQSDGRKREYFLARLARQIDPQDFSFKIMGDGWNKYVDILGNNGFAVEYTDHFNYEKYIKLIPQLDYYLYMGQDEGQMGFLDAAAAGIPTIVTLQGYHLDARNAIKYGFHSLSDLISIFTHISAKRQKIVNSVSNWSWTNYAQKHVEIWKFLIAKQSVAGYSLPSLNYNDGINSVNEFDKNTCKKNITKSIIKNYKLYETHCKRYLAHKIGKFRELGLVNGSKYFYKKLLLKWR